MGAVLTVVGILCVVYGIFVMVPGSHTYFFLIWIVFGIALLTVPQAWGTLPHGVRVGICACACALAAPLVWALVCIVGKMGERAEPGLDVLVCLGAWVKPNGTPSEVLKTRLSVTADYLRQSPHTRCIVSGGQGPTEPSSEAYAMRACLVAAGVDPERVILEEASTNTRENLAFSRALIPAGTTVGIVTSGFHLCRALRIARVQGMGEVRGIAAPSRILFMPHNLLRESVCLLKDVATGAA